MASLEEMNKGVQLANNQQYKAAEQAFEKAASLSKDNHSAPYNLGMVLNQQKNYEKAAEAFGEAVKRHDKDAMYHYRYGKALYESEKKDMAQTHLERSVDLNGRLFKAHYYLGRIYNEKDRQKDAAESWTTAAKLNPTFGRAFISLGRLYWQWDMIDKAIQVLDNGRNTVTLPDQLTDIYFYLGLAYDAQKNWPKSIEAYSQALEVKSDNVEARLQRGFAYANKGEKAKAKKDLEEFVQQGGGGNSFNIQAANDRLMSLL
jgi:tetratricopeptide (TPR) repeat protein